MASASFLQSSFLGGRFSPSYQGRADDPRYRLAMKECLNAFPIEPGAWTRRPGTRVGGPTRGYNPGRLREFHFQQDQPYNMEFTDGHIRFWSGPNIVTDSSFGVLAVSTASPAVVETATAHGWATGDEVVFALSSLAPDTDLSGIFPLLGQQFVVTVTDTTHFELHHIKTNAAIDGSSLAYVPGYLSVSRILDFATSYSGTMYQDVRTVQDENRVLVLHPLVSPRQVVALTSPTASAYATFDFVAHDLLDGPYLDPEIDGSTLTPSALTGSITLTASASKFKSTDVDRLIRLFSEPPDYATGTTYAAGDSVKYNDAYYTSLTSSNTGNNPELDQTDWAVDANAARWTYAKVTAYTDATHVTVTILNDDLLYSGSGIIRTYRLGLFGTENGWPKGGVYFQDRFWFFGVQGNRIDATKTNGVNADGSINFSPTGVDGTVADDNGLSIVLQATDRNTILWAAPTEQGLILGTQGGEWLIRAGQTDDPITPTSIRAKRMSKIGSANVEPLVPGNSLIFVQRNNRKIIEYSTKLYSDGYSGNHLSEASKDLFLSTALELAEQRETTPILWARMEDGSLAGCTYRRSAPYSTMPPDFWGWHRHDLGHGRSVISIQGGPSTTGNLDTLSLITQDANGLCFFEQITDLYEDTQTLTDAWFVDGASPPTWAKVITSGGNDYVRLYGYQQHAGEQLSVWAGGLDMGDFTVASDGSVDVPLGAASSLLTASYLTTLTSETFNVPAVTIRNEATPTGLAPDTGSITEFIDTLGDGTGNSNSHFHPDWDNGVGWYATTGGTARLNKFNLADATEAWSKTEATLTTNFVLTSEMGIAPAPDGTVYIADATSGVVHISADGATVTKGNLTYMPQPDQLCVLDTSAGYFIVGTQLVAVAGGGSEGDRGCGISVVDGTALGPVVLSGVSVTKEYTSPFLFKGPKYGDGSATAYIVTPPLEHIGPSTNSPAPPGIYLLTVSAAGAASCRLLANLTASQVHSDWLWIAGVDSAMYDETDGTLLVQVHIDVPGNWAALTAYDDKAIVRGSDGHDYQSVVAGTASNTGNDPTLDITHTYWTDLGAATYSAEHRLIKVSGDGTSVLWSLVMAATNEGFDARSRVRRGRLATYHTHLGSYSDIDLYDTSGGLHLSTTNVLGVTTSLQAYNDKTGQAVFYADSFVPGAGTPVGTNCAGGFTSDWAMYGPQTPTSPTYYIAPFVAGFNFTSRGQLLRPIAPDASGAQNGPALAKIRRIFQLGVLLLNSAGIKFGTDFTDMRPAMFKTDGGTDYTALQAFSGVYWDPVEDGHDFDGQLAWEVSRPYPTTVLAVSGFINTQDR